MKTIVIVEDELRTRLGLAHLIAKLDMGCKVIGEAENGYEGIKLITASEPDVVITDIQMGKMDGLDMIKNARELGCKSLFVILSGHADFGYAQTAIRLGVTEYLLKPVSIKAVKELLEKITGANGDKVAKKQLESGYSDIVAEMLSDMKKNYGLKLGLITYSERFHMTPEYLSNLFAKEAGCTFSTFLKKVRVEKAKELILNSDKKIYEIAYMVGYPDQKYFSKVFKECTGVSAKRFALHKRSE